MSDYGAQPNDGMLAQDRLKVFCIGDSRMVGNFSTSLGGCRMELFQSLRNRLGYSPRFVGSDSYNSFIFPMCGMSGETTAGIITRLATQAALYPNCNVIIIDIGVNDAIGGTAAATIANDVDSIVTTLRAQSPNAVILVALTVDYDTFTSQVVAYNAALTTKMQARNDYAANPALAKTSLYDMYTAIGPYGGTYFANGGHLNAAGYTIEANGWYNKIINVF